MSAVFFQDMFGLITFGAELRTSSHAIRPRIGKNQVIHRLDAYQFQHRHCSRCSAPTASA